MRTFILLCAVAPLVALGCTGEATQASTSTAQAAAPMANAVALRFILDTPPSCEGCVAHIQSVVEKLDGFSELVATPQDPEIVVKVDPAKLDAEQVLAALTANDRPGHVKP